MSGPLTEADLDRVRADRDAWTSAALSTDRCDRPAAEEAVRRVYAAAGHEPPSIVWMDSPLGGALCAAVLRDQLRDQLWDQLRDQLGGQLGDQLGGQLGGQLWGQLRDQLRDQLGGQLGDQLRDQLDPWRDAYWACHLRAACRYAGIESPRLDTLVEALPMLGWWWPLEGVAVLTDRPTVIARDPQGRLHCADGPALAYADGHVLHAWHGVTVPDDFGGWDAERALAETNAEVRRCAIERLGWDTVTDRLTLVAEADDPGNAPHTLRLYDLPGDMGDLYDEPARILLCHNASLDKGGHRRAFGLPVPAEHDDPVAAAADLFGVPRAAYAGLATAT